MNSSRLKNRLYVYFTLAIPSCCMRMYMNLFHMISHSLVLCTPCLYNGIHHHTYMELQSFQSPTKFE